MSEPTDLKILAVLERIQQKLEEKRGRELLDMVRKAEAEEGAKRRHAELIVALRTLAYLMTDEGRQAQAQGYALPCEASREQLEAKIAQLPDVHAAKQALRAMARRADRESPF